MKFVLKLENPIQLSPHHQEPNQLSQKLFQLDLRVLRPLLQLRQLTPPMFLQLYLELLFLIQLIINELSLFQCLNLQLYPHKCRGYLAPLLVLLRADNAHRHAGSGVVLYEQLRDVETGFQHAVPHVRHEEFLVDLLFLLIDLVDLVEAPCPDLEVSPLTLCTESVE